MGLLCSDPNRGGNLIRFTDDFSSEILTTDQLVSPKKQVPVNERSINARQLEFRRDPRLDYRFQKKETSKEADWNLSRQTNASPLHSRREKGRCQIPVEQPSGLGNVIAMSPVLTDRDFWSRKNSGNSQVREALRPCLIEHEMDRLQTEIENLRDVSIADPANYPSSPKVDEDSASSTIKCYRDSSSLGFLEPNPNQSSSPQNSRVSKSGSSNNGFERSLAINSIIYDLKKKSETVGAEIARLEQWSVNAIFSTECNYTKIRQLEIEKARLKELKAVLWEQISKCLSMLKTGTLAVEKVSISQTEHEIVCAVSNLILPVNFNIKCDEQKKAVRNPSSIEPISPKTNALIQYSTILPKRGYKRRSYSWPGDIKTKLW